MEISLIAEPIFHLNTVPITNALIIAIIINIGFIWFFTVLAKKIKIIPSFKQNIVEYAFEALLSFIDGVTQDREQTKKFFPLIATIFIFVAFSNWIELVPGLGTIGIREVHAGESILIPFIRSASADLNMTLAVAIISVVGIQAMGVSVLGARNYAKKFFVNPFHKPYFIGTFVGALDIVGEFVKIVSFSFRLFGNIFAGEVLLTVVLNLVPYIVPLPFLMLELFVGFVQALVFSMLTLVFFKIAVTEASH